MRYSTEPKYRKYVEGYGFLSFAKKFGDKYILQYILQQKQEEMLQKLLLKEWFKKLQKLQEI